VECSSAACFLCFANAKRTQTEVCATEKQAELTG
jgi:hypothetical protein